MQGCIPARQDREALGGGSVASARRIAGRAVRSILVAAVIAAMAVFLPATLPAVDGSGQFGTSAIADERPSDRNDGGRNDKSGKADDDDQDDDDRGHDKDRDDDRDDDNDDAGDDDNDDAGDDDNNDAGDDDDDVWHDDDRDDGGPADKSRDRGATSGGAGGIGPNSVGHDDPGGGVGGRGDDDDGTDRPGARGDGGGGSAGDLFDGELEAGVAVSGATDGLEAFRAKVLSPDEEAAAIAAGWTPAD